jgi:hypothetical protein
MTYRGRRRASSASGLPARVIRSVCVHTHGAGVAAILPNLYVKTGGATYGHPRVAEVLDLSGPAR